MELDLEKLFFILGILLGIVCWLFLKKYLEQISFRILKLFEQSVFVSKNVKLVIFVPEESVDNIKKAIGKAGAGRIEFYDCCSFSTRGIGTYRPLDEAKPAIGKNMEISLVVEIRIETICPKEKARDIIEAAKKVHPYETMGYDIYPLLELKRD